MPLCMLYRSTRPADVPTMPKFPQELIATDDTGASGGALLLLPLAGTSATVPVAAPTKRSSSARLEGRLFAPSGAGGRRRCSPIVKF